jgi:hypothetical protein
MQSTSNLLLIRPAAFAYNQETALSNAFQNNNADNNGLLLNEKAMNEFDAMVYRLTEKGVNVIVFDDTKVPEKPDAVFPNNWVSFHVDGTVIIYPMLAPNRRLERRKDIIEELKKTFLIQDVMDLSSNENENRYLEGTGSIVFDHNNKVAYASLSDRTDKDLFIQLCETIAYEPIYFTSTDASGKKIYHTNVIMCIGDNFAVVCLDCITNPAEKELVFAVLAGTGHQVVEISLEQVSKFAGNMLAVVSKQDESFLVMSSSAFNVLTREQKKMLQLHTELLPVDVQTIEAVGGGSARCMIAEIFLPVL